jgi:two-component system LytT family response regulator
MTKSRVLIVDDERPGRERVRRLLARDSRVELAGCCEGGIEALDAFRKSSDAGAPIHLLFLDVQMPEMTGLDVAAALAVEPAPPAVVFVTAHDEYAVRAFEAHALDYLLKPFSDERFQASLDRALRHVGAGQAHRLMEQMQALLGAGRKPTDEPTPSRPKRALDRIVLKSAHRVRLLPVDQIGWIEADGMYVKLHTRDGAVHQQRGLLGSFDTSLDARRFVRIHRSAIVNIDVVQELRQDPHGDYIAVLRDHTELRIGRRFRARLQERLGQPL